MRLVRQLFVGGDQDCGRDGAASNFGGCLRPFTAEKKTSESPASACAHGGYGG